MESNLIRRWIGVLFGAVGIFFIVYLDSRFGGHGQGHNHALMANMSYALLLMTGFMTSFHCVGMCGAMVLSYTTQDTKLGKPSYFSHFWYGLGKTASYTILGAGFGALGAVIAFTPWLRGIIAISAGMFLVLFGLSMLNLLPGMGRIQLKTPTFVMRFIGRQYKKHSHPFMIGLLNGLMIVCGPLQAMYIMAAGSGSPLEGAKILFFFGLGTLPVMLGFGVFASTLAKSIGPKLVKFSSVVVVVLGAVMLNRGLALADTGYDLHSILKKNQEKALSGIKTLSMRITKHDFEPDHFVIKRNEPIRWIIHVEKDAFCKGQLEIPSLEINVALKPGTQALEFSIPRKGLILWHCTQPLRYGAFTVQ
ncbi:MAG TPA: sulfite exporter TauE/SafE family protein [Methylothermaceae bacterium]|nr:sulfite exporter TauE/SafE family protein [Methylothermaceae bacterium]